MIENIRRNAELVQSIAHKQLGIDVGFDRAAVQWLDGFITRQHAQGDPSNFNGLVNTLGSFLGECIIDTFGGEWARDEYGWCVRFDEKNATYPFSKVEKQLKNGATDSVLSFFDVIPVLFKHEST